jgi:hypothetical protein
MTPLCELNDKKTEPRNDIPLPDQITAAREVLTSLQQLKAKLLAADIRIKAEKKSVNAAG